MSTRSMLLGLLLLLVVALISVSIGTTITRGDRRPA
eukprot:CAMPEP_0174741570 /NCGR_PEP_ID=MMETSP1094-20130205/76700_1 /TAXON_ID=156173 /ORGANISM="Chrysochromulina brevifilum, Strain UTEX LB 985" /LENGTH=35 /DNA_ID= /DNA_START= /DNA_END= /DNA_ORIENTATION=